MGGFCFANLRSMTSVMTLLNMSEISVPLSVTLPGAVPTSSVVPPRGLLALIVVVLAVQTLGLGISRVFGDIQ